jgi:hypothetical protein
MSVFNSISDLIVSVSTYGDLKSVYKDARVGASAAQATVAGQITSLWQYNGSPSGGAAPTTVVAPTSATAGALQQANAGGTRSKYLLCTAATSGSAGTLILYDRLLTIGNLSGTTTGAQTVGGALNRYTGGPGNQIFAEIYTAVGSTGTTVTASYTNQSGTSGQTTASSTFGSTGYQEAQRLLYLPLQSGDTGVQAVASATLAASTLTAGAWGITVAHPLAVLPIGVPACGTVRDHVAGIPDFPLITPSACLAWMWVANTTTAPQVYATVHMTEK